MTAADLEAENVRLRAALKPFADWYGELVNHPVKFLDGLPLFISFRERATLGEATVADLKRAAEAIEQPQTEGGR